MNGPERNGGAHAAQRLLAARLPQLVVEQVETIDSTNSELLRRVRSGDSRPTLLRALEQTAGRGRQGRSWHSDATALCFSLMWPSARTQWDGLSLAMGVAVVEALRALAPARPLGLKWPNDVWALSSPADATGALVAAKLAGILVETAAPPGSAVRCVIVGVGVNIDTPDEGVAQGRGVAPIGLRACAAGAVDADSVWAAMAPALWDAVQGFEATGFGPFRSRFEAMDVLRGRVVRYGAPGGQPAEGEAAGIDASGHLLVHTCPRSGPPAVVVGGDVSVRLAVPSTRS